MTIGGVDTYYDYDEKQWKYRRLGGGPVRRKPVCPLPESISADIPHEDKPWNRTTTPHQPGRK